MFLNYATNKPIPRNDCLYKKIIYREIGTGAFTRVFEGIGLGEGELFDRVAPAGCFATSVISLY